MKTATMSRTQEAKRTHVLFFLQQSENCVLYTLCEHYFGKPLLFVALETNGCDLWQNTLLT